MEPGDPPDRLELARAAEPQGPRRLRAHPSGRPSAGRPPARHLPLWRDVVLSWVFLVGAFYVIAIGHESGLRAFVRLGLDIALVGAVFAWQIRRISVAALPELRAVEALGIVIALFLVLFSGIYLAMSHESPLRPSRNRSTTPGRSTSPSPSSRPSASATSRRGPTRRASSSRPRCCSTSPSSAPPSASSSTPPGAGSRPLRQLPPARAFNSGSISPDGSSGTLLPASTPHPPTLLGGTPAERSQS